MLVCVRSILVSVKWEEISVECKQFHSDLKCDILQSFSLALVAPHIPRHTKNYNHMTLINCSSTRRQRMRPTDWGLLYNS